MKFTYKTGNSTNNNSNNNSNIRQKINEPSSVPVKNQMIWGNATWTFFHTLCHKIKEPYFNKLRQPLLDYIVKICNYLPCPICTTHAKQYLNNVNFNTIQTKKDLKDMLFHFHNNVNSKKSFQQFPYNKVDPLYESANLISAFNFFRVNYTVRMFNVKSVIDNNNRNEVINSLQTWLRDNIQYFNS